MLPSLGMDTRTAALLRTTVQLAGSTALLSLTCGVPLAFLLARTAVPGRKVVGALLISMITNGLGLLGYSAGFTFLVTGGVLIIAATIDALSRRRSGSSTLAR